MSKLPIAARADRRAFAAFYERHAVTTHAWFSLHASQDLPTLDDSYFCASSSMCARAGTIDDPRDATDHLGESVWRFRLPDHHRVATFSTAQSRDHPAG